MQNTCVSSHGPVRAGNKSQAQLRDTLWGSISSGALGYSVVFLLSWSSSSCCGESSFLLLMLEGWMLVLGLG